VTAEETERVPETIATEPMLLSMVNEVALLVVHESVEESPAWMEVGFAASEQVGAAGGGWVTVTVAEQLTVWPTAFIAVPVYVVVLVGETERLPLATGVSAPTP
jgi:hypothetical protein